MPENKILDLSLEFAVTIVNLVDGVTAPKSSSMTDSLQEQAHPFAQISTKRSMHRARKTLLRSWKSL